MTDSTAYGLIYLDGKMVSVYVMTSSMKLKVETSIDPPRGTIHRDLISLRDCLHRRCCKIFPDEENLNFLVQKILSDTFEYHLATLQRHEMFIYLIANTIVQNLRFTNESVNKTIDRCIKLVREYLSATSKMESIYHAKLGEKSEGLFTQMPLVILGSTDPEPLRRRLSQPIQ